MKTKELNQKLSRIQSRTEKLNNMIKDLLSDLRLADHENLTGKKLTKEEKVFGRELLEIVK